jgi:hypothetical protein
MKFEKNLWMIDRFLEEIMLEEKTFLPKKLREVYFFW